MKEIQAVNGHMNEVEEDFIEFLALKYGGNPDALKNKYLKLRKQFDFGSNAYRKFCRQSLDIHELVYGVEDESLMLEIYRRHEIIFLLRFISYFEGFQKPPRRRFSRYPKQLIRGDRNKDLKKTKHEKMVEWARFAGELAGGRPVVVDYGCGFGYRSFQIARLFPGSKVFLIDIDTMTLGMAEFRFRKRGFDVDTVHVTADNLYPKLPRHNICIVSEVMEHVKKPLAVLENIRESLEVGGILYGDFGDHEDETYHVSSCLKDVRESVKSDFEMVGRDTYKRVR